MTLEYQNPRRHSGPRSSTSSNVTAAASSTPCSAGSSSASSAATAESSSQSLPPAVPGPLVQSIFQRAHANSPPDDAAGQVKRLVDEWNPEISRNGLTSATVVRDPLIGRDPSTITNANEESSRQSSDDPPPPSRPKTLQAKRTSEEDSAQPLQHLPVQKRPRLESLGGRWSLGPLPQTPVSFSPGPDGLTSPLFFSNSVKHMTSRPPSFSASEAAASLLSRMQKDHEDVTVVKLPRGHVSSASPAASTSTPGSRASMDASGSSRSPDARTLNPVLKLIQGAGVIELLEQDDRPTFIIDLQDGANFNPGPLQIVFANAALRAAQKVTELLMADNSSPSVSAEFSRFKAWAVSFVKNNESMDVCLPSLSYGGISWTCSTLRKRFRFVSGNISAVSLTPTSPSAIAQASTVLEERARGPTPQRDPTTPKGRPYSGDDYFGDVSAAVSSPPESRPRSHSEPPESTPGLEMAMDIDKDGTLSTGELESMRQSFDWTRIALDTPNLPPHIAFARSIDWANTPIGPVENWPSELRSMSNMIMGSPYAAAMYWGPEYVAIYNEAYIEVAGKHHPRLMGMRYRDVWSEIWDDIEPVFESAWEHGQATMKHDDRLFMFRNGFLEETFFNWSIIPLVGGDGAVVALYNPAFENTKRKVSERRMLTLREVGEKTSQARDNKSFWAQVLKGLEYNEYDVPFAMIYSVTEDSESEVSSMHSGSLTNPPAILLEGCIGVKPTHPLAVPSIDLRTSEEGFAPFMRESMGSLGEPIVIRRDNPRLGNMLEGIEWRGYGDPSQTIVVFPVHPTTAGDTVVGFIIMGINPRRPYDDDYRLFVNLLSRQLATSMASVVLFEEEIKRGQRAARLAALDRQELSLQLRLRTEEAVESEYRFTRMAEFAPVGMFIADAKGRINYCNDMWWQISRHPKAVNSVDTWMLSIHDADRSSVEAIWRRLVTEKVAISHEFRFKHQGQNTDGITIDTWVLLAAYPEKDASGGLKSIFGCITDISQLKWAEGFQKQRRDEAVELKRQQENFIDITSHEMRNPLSAILQCADEITGTLDKYKSADPAFTLANLNVLLESCLEAANTIALCASHQKRIVDDILTLSKLDSQLLLVTPVPVYPVSTVQEILRMFEPELRSNDIKAEFLVEPSYRDLGFDCVMLDPSRLRQVLINIMTNAIKFTQSQEERSITIRLGASRDPAEAGEVYIPSERQDQRDITDGDDWGRGEKINLHLTIKDTGPGLDDNEKKMLFQRFSQASPRTHVQYGGSGLGLFISRILTELQGGMIGVSSEKGLGSTFSFYIKSRKAEVPAPRPEIRSATTTPKTNSPSVMLATNLIPGRTDQASASWQSDVSPQLLPSAIVPTMQITSGSRLTGTISPIHASTRPPLDILIVEDNLVNQKVLQRQLRISGNNTHVANHGGEALEALRRSRYWNPAATMPPPARPGSSSGSASPKEPLEKDINISVILMDLEMPVMNGMSCARRIRELEREGTITRHIPIIAVTAYARPEQIEGAKAAGMDDVISKPFRIPELIPKIEELVQKYETAPSFPQLPVAA